jgi:hypothetical protein
MQGQRLSPCMHAGLEGGGAALEILIEGMANSGPDCLGGPTSLCHHLQSLPSLGSSIFYRIVPQYLIIRNFHFLVKKSSLCHLPRPLCRVAAVLPHHCMKWLSLSLSTESVHCLLKL